MHDSQTKRYTAIFRLLALRKHKICIEMKYFLLEHTLLLLKSQKIQNYSFALVGTLHMYLMYVISNIFFCRQFWAALIDYASINCTKSISNATKR